MEPQNDIDTQIQRMQKQVPVMHYHGDKVRIIYLAMAVIMLIATPLFKYKLLIVQSFAGIIAVVGIAIFAGLTNPRSRWVMVIDLMISVSAFLIFGYQTIITYTNTLNDSFFLTNLLLAVLAIFAVYFSSKTLRGNILL